MSSVAKVYSGNKVVLTALQVGLWKTAAAGLNIDLFQNNYTPSRISTLADFIVADFTGYSAGLADAFTTIAMDGVTGDWFTRLTTPKVWTQSGVTITNTVYGWWLSDGFNVLLAERFDTPIQMDTTGKTITIDPKFYVNGLSGASNLDEPR